jgi:hypothetical protein
MTPKEKANRLVKRYINLYPHPTEEYLDIYESKQCALIAVEELIEDNKINEELVNGGLNKEYWEKVKYEIEKL